MLVMPAVTHASSSELARAVPELFFSSFFFAVVSADAALREPAASEP
jgi:hypothetical protein